MKEFRHCPYCGEKFEYKVSLSPENLWKVIDEYCYSLGTDPDCSKCKYGQVAHILVGEYDCWKLFYKVQQILEKE